jgi:hypothetical protein
MGFLEALRRSLQISLMLPAARKGYRGSALCVVILNSYLMTVGIQRDQGQREFLDLSIAESGQSSLRNENDLTISGSFWQRQASRARRECKSRTYRFATRLNRYE